MILIVARCKAKLPRLPFNLRHSFQVCSTYRFYLSSFATSWLLATLTVAIQGWIIVIFFQAGDKTYPGNLWLYSVSCPEDSLECQDQSLTNGSGWIVFGIILATFLLPDLLEGTLIAYESAVDFNVNGIFAGMILLNITVLTIVASSIYLYATSISNIALMKDAAIVLFLNSIDEQVYVIIQKARPFWIDELEADIIQYSLSHWYQDRSDICEVMDDPNDPNYASNIEGQGQADMSDILCDDTHLNRETVEQLKNRVEMLQQTLSAKTAEMIKANEIDLSETNRTYENNIDQLIQQYEDEKERIKYYHEKMILECTELCEKHMMMTRKEYGLLRESEIALITPEEIDANQPKIKVYFQSLKNEL